VPVDSGGSVKIIAGGNAEFADRFGKHSGKRVAFSHRIGYPDTLKH
jgi:hypothetical protein